jgi:hypothetical protein
MPSLRRKNRFFVAFLNVAESGRGFERRNPVLCRRNKFVRHEPRVTRGHDRFRHYVVIQLLGAIDFVPSRNAAGVEMPDMGDIVADGPDHVAFHNLHVIDVVAA